MSLVTWLVAFSAIAFSTTPVAGQGITDLRECAPWVVDEGADIALTSLQTKQKMLSAQFRAFYNNFFSRGDYKLQDQMFFIRLDSRQPSEPDVTGTKSQLLTLNFSNVAGGQHRLFYGTYDIDHASNHRVAEGHAVCFTVDDSK